MSKLKSSGIIYQAQYFEENITVQAGGQGQGVFSKTTHTTSSIQTTTDVVPLDAATKEILEKNRQMLADIYDENLKKEISEIDSPATHVSENVLSVDKDQQIGESVEEKIESDDSLGVCVSSDDSSKSDANDDIWGIGEYQEDKENVSEDDSMFNFDGAEDNESKKFEDYSTLMESDKRKPSKKSKKHASSKKTKRSRFRFGRGRKGTSRSTYSKKSKQREKSNRAKRALSDQENDSKLKIGLSVIKQDMPVRIIVGIIVGIAFIAIVLLGRLG